MSTILVRICPDRDTREGAIQRIMRIPGRVPYEREELFIPELGRAVPVFMLSRANPEEAERLVWCSGTPHDIVHLQGVEPEWVSGSCLNC